ncbi:triose-phosphate isomerase [Candidatus Saccharibacteria bacterium]|nr:triose-phosphate isomerase [Candidatus Saccharibacteria bacterium]
MKSSHQDTQKIIVGNWKLNTTVSEGTVLLKRIHTELRGMTGAQVVVCPPATHLFALREEIHTFKSLPKLSLGAQNISEYEEGAYTGEVSAEMVKELAEYVLVGHSERRKYFDETDKLVAQTVDIALRHGLKVILCIGENELQHNDGHSKQTVLDQLSVDLSEVTSKELDNVIIAYEPVWAIGTGKFAKPAQAEEMAQLIKSTVTNMYSHADSSEVPVLYGGSVDPDNAKAYLDEPSIDGLLVGGASLNYKKFAAIARLAMTKEPSGLKIGL